MSRRYLIIIEPTSTGFSAFPPDVPGCAAAGGTREVLEENMRGALDMHLEGLRAEGLPIPEPRTSSSYVDV
jgi:predicted RNase H-like HicB family nuclease